MKFGLAARPSESTGGDYTKGLSCRLDAQKPISLLRNDSGVIGMQGGWSRPGCLAARTATKHANGRRKNRKTSTK
ncbi:MAG TPA: hypothetical protein VFL07_17545 [Rudaea sp.]|jgi:hypothetical protein|nr:hypothetical protein [Rudaea sp.]HSC12459.1 hypothetical protein [Rhodanobacteraceae bacterium]